MTGETLKTSRFYLWVPRPQMVDVKYLMEGFEGLCLVRTMDGRIGLMEVMVQPGGEAEFQPVLAALLEAYPQIRLAPPPERQPREQGPPLPTP